MTKPTGKPRGRPKDPPIWKDPERVYLARTLALAWAPAPGKRGVVGVRGASGRDALSQKGAAYRNSVLDGPTFVHITEKHLAPEEAAEAERQAVKIRRIRTRDPRENVYLGRLAEAWIIAFAEADYMSARRAVGVICGDLGDEAAFMEVFEPYLKRRFGVP